MGIHTIEITYHGGVPGGRGFPLRDYHDMRRAAMEDVGNFWHEHYRGEHFEFSAYQRYGYTPRTTKYEIRKAKNLGHRRPLVFTGESEERRRYAGFTSP